MVVLRTLVAMLALLATPALASCDTPENIKKRLSEFHKEAPVIWGTTRNGQLMEIYAATDGDWTIVVTRNNLSCVFSSGQNLTLDGMKIMEVFTDGI